MRLVLTNIKSVPKDKLVNALNDLFYVYGKSYWENKYDEEIGSDKITIVEGTDAVYMMHKQVYIREHLKWLNKHWNSNILLKVEYNEN